jgi:hypothetical protein
MVSLAGIHKYAKVRTSLHSESYQPSGMLIHRQILYAARNTLAAMKRRIVGLVNKVKILPVF